MSAMILTKKKSLIFFLFLHPKGIVAEWLGGALQKLLQRFESARCLNLVFGSLVFFLLDQLLSTLLLFCRQADIFFLSFLLQTGGFFHREHKSHPAGLLL